MAKLNGHERRRQRIIDRIEKTALDLFTNDGGDQVSMDEIAGKASVSKVTIYKYFHSKEELKRAVINLYTDEALSAIEKILDSDLDFVEKLKIAVLAQVNSPKVADYQALSEFLEKDDRTAGGSQGSLKLRIREIMYRFYEEGKKAGYVAEDLSFDLLNAYSEIFLAGIKDKSANIQALLADPKSREQLLHIYIYGIIRR